MFSAVKPQKTYEIVTEQIRREITEGRLKPGDKLPSERELAERMSVSRVSVREAIKKMIHMGFLKTIPADGTYVDSKTGNLFPDSLLREQVEQSEELFFDLMDVFKVQAGWAAFRAAKNHAEEKLSRLQTIGEATGLTSKIEDIANLCYEFHQTLAEMTQNRVYIELCPYLANASLYAIQMRLEKSGNLKEDLERIQHGLQAIYLQIKANSPTGAKRAMEQHLQQLSSLQEFAA